MSNLSNFIYCLEVEREQGNGNSINARGILTTIIPEYVPGSFSFSIIFSVLDADTKSANEVRIVFRNSNGDVIIDTEALKLPPIADEAAIQIPPEYTGFNMSLDFRNVVFATEGEYVTDVYFNGTMIGSKAIYVKGKH